MKPELGPTYNVPLIDSLPINQANPNGWTQAMPSRADLLGVKDYRQGQRVVAGYEVLLNHWREQGEEIERLRKREAAIKQEAKREVEHKYLTNELQPVELLREKAAEVERLKSVEEAYLSASAEDANTIADYEARHATSLEVITAREQHAESQRLEIERLRAGLRGIRREFGYLSINNGTATLAGFIDMLVNNDVDAAKALQAAEAGGNDAT